MEGSQCTRNKFTFCCDNTLTQNQLGCLGTNFWLSLQCCTYIIMKLKYLGINCFDDPLYKFWLILDHLNLKLWSAYKPEENLTTDELHVTFQATAWKYFNCVAKSGYMYMQLRGIPWCIFYRCGTWDMIQCDQWTVQPSTKWMLPGRYGLIIFRCQAFWS
jgi:hypothetical protein